MRHPIQPLEEDKNGVLRFKENAIVRTLLNVGPLDMNALAEMNFSREDREQFAQLIGYSLSGFSELGYVKNDTYEAAEATADGKNEKDARIEVLENKLACVRKHLKELVPEIFQVHPDDLVE